MALIEHMKLARLKINAYKAVERRITDLVGSFEVMFNPSMFSQKFELNFSSQQAVNDSNPTARYTHTAPQELQLEFVLDGTGVHQAGINLFEQATVSDQLNKFLELTRDVNGDIHEPNFLQLEWGGKKNPLNNFKCRLSSVDIKYTAFDRHGEPLRAELEVVLISDIGLEEKLAEARQNSPDMTHYRVVKAGDTLPLLTKEIYGSSRYYLRVAQVNELDDFRDLAPGMKLRFPPLEK